MLLICESSQLPDLLQPCFSSGKKRTKATHRGFCKKIFLGSGGYRGNLHGETREQGADIRPGGVHLVRVKKWWILGDVVAI